MAQPDIFQLRDQLKSMQDKGASPQDVWKAISDAGYTPEQFQQLTQAAKVAKSAPAPENPVMGGIRSLNNGLTFGLNNQIGGGIDALIEKIKGNPASLSSLYQQGTANERLQQNQMDVNHPLVSTAAKMAGGVAATALPPVGRVLGGAMQAGQPVMNAARAAVAGGGVGAVSGAANAQPGDTLNGAVTGMGVGAATGAAMGPVVAGANRMMGGAADALDGAVQRLRAYSQAKLGGQPAPIQPQAPAPGPGGFAGAPSQIPQGATPGPQLYGQTPPAGPPAAPGAVSSVLSQMERDGTSPAALRARLQGASQIGKPQSIAAVADPTGNVQGQARSTFTIPGPSRNVAAQALDQSVAGMPGRVTQDLSGFSGLPATDTEALQGSLQARRSAQAGPAYDKAYAQGAISDPQLASTLESNPTYARAHQGAIDQHNENSPAGSHIPGLFGEDGRLVRDPTVQDLDFIKKGLDAQLYNANGPVMSSADSYKKIGLNPLQDARTNLMSQVDPLAPDYAAARQQFGSTTELADALEAGRSLVTSGRTASPADVKANLASLSDAGKQAYRAGVQDALHRQVLAAADRSNANVADTIMGSGQGSKAAMLKAVFGDGPEYERFVAQMQAEQQRAQLRNFVKGGSQTANKQEEVGDQAREAAQTAAGGLGSILKSAAGKAYDAVASHVGAEHRAAVAQELFAPRAGDQADSFLRALDELSARRAADRSGNAAGLTYLAPGASGAAASQFNSSR